MIFRHYDEIGLLKPAEKLQAVMSYTFCLQKSAGAYDIVNLKFTLSFAIVADDEPDICQLIRRYAEHDGYEMVGVSDGTEAAEIWRTAPLLYDWY